MIQTLIKLERSGDLKKLLKVGLLSTKTLLYYEVFLEFDKLKRTTQKKTMDIASEVSEKFGISEGHVFKIVRTLK